MLEGGRSRRAAEDDALGAVPPGLRIAAAWGWRLLLVVGVLAVVGLLVQRLQSVVVPFLVAVLLSALLVPFARFLRAHGWPRWIAVLTSWVLVLAAVAALVVLVTAQVRYDLPMLEQRLHHTVRSLRDLVDAQPFGITARDVNHWVSQLSDLVEAHGASVAAGFRAAGTSAVHAAEAVFIVLFSTLVFTIDDGRTWRWIVGLFPRRARGRIVAAGDAGWRTLSSFIRIQLVVAVTDAIGVALGAFLLGVPLALPIGVIVFMGAFVPVVGAIVAGIVAVAIALVFNGWVVALVLLGVVVLVQQLESHVLHPFLTGSVVKVHPLGIVLGVAAGATLAGVVGAFFAVPAIATVNAMVLAAARSGARDSGARADHGGVQS
jgi:putative heme transporter